ncbi:hypothetical protein WSM22_20100 [Cytophagales bacterium WSM2-2]|nr:hypothetical protein WSM22_20100 [Cytophagales bacterium WSM2-2]
MNFKSLLYFSCIVIVFVIATDSCTEQKLTVSSSPSVSPVNTTATSSTNVQPHFNKSVGAPISREIAMRWMANYKTKTGATAEYFIKAGDLQKILADNNCIGISLHYATDTRGQLVIIPIGIDADGKLMKASTVANELSWTTAWQWIDNYRGEMKSHFFGMQTFARLLTEQKATLVRASLAKDDKGQQQLLLSNASNADPDDYEDESRKCPPQCPNQD